LGVLRINIDEDDFRPHILDLAQDGVGGASGKAEMPEDGAAHLGAFDAMLEHRKAFSILAKKGDCYTVHGWGLADVPSMIML
jgi:hypothetical protein